MDFFNIGGGELLVIILLALILFRPEDIYKAMRKLGRYTRSARQMWNEFSSNIKQEMDTREVEAALAETKTLISSAADAVSTLKTSVTDVKKSVEGDVSAAGKSLKDQATEGVAVLKAQSTPTIGAVAGAQDAAKEAVTTLDDALTSTVGAVRFGSAPMAGDVGVEVSDTQAAGEADDLPTDEAPAQ